MRKPWKWLLAGNALLVLGLLCLTWNYRGQRITRENADRIKPGMTSAEVEAILGPPRNEVGGRGVPIPGYLFRIAFRADGVEPTLKRWIGKSLAISVLIYPDWDCVVNVRTESVWLRDPTWSERVEARWNKCLGK